MHALFVMDRAPYEDAATQEKLDLVLMGAAFDWHVAVLWLDQGVYQLLAGTTPPHTGHLAGTALAHTLRWQGIDACYVEAESLTERGLCRDALALPVTPIARAELGAWLNRFDLII